MMKMKIVVLFILALSFLSHAFAVNVNNYFLALALYLAYIGLVIVCFTLIVMHWKGE